MAIRSSDCPITIAVAVVMVVVEVVLVVVVWGENITRCIILREISTAII